MWSVKSFAHSNEEQVLIPPDDVVFTAVLKRGPTVHIGRTSYVRCYHVAEIKKGYQLGLEMSILDATSTEMKHSEFSDDGLMGKWKLIAPKNGNVPKVALVESISDVNDFLQEATDSSNPEWIRSSYQSLQIKKQ